MKKTYNIPTLTVVNVQPAQFIASSTPNAKFSTTGSTNKMDGRQGSFSGWNDDPNDE